MSPDEFTNQEFLLKVSDGHQIYVHDWGNRRQSQPILFLHGGPGGQVDNGHRLNFDPNIERVIFFDQRGCGKSLPYGSLDNNTTSDIVSDIIKIAAKLNIDQFVITGNSWGSTLALFFALAHPERVKAMVISGIWTGSKTEIDWLDRGGFKQFFPDAWQKYLMSVPQKHRTNPSKYHFARILGKSGSVSDKSAYAYANLEASVMALDDRYQAEEVSSFDASGTRIEVHYLNNGCFMPDNYILNNAATLTMPIWLVQGRYDMVCPPATAYKLSQLLPNSHLILTTSGHKSEHESWNLKRSLLLQICQSQP